MAGTSIRLALVVLCLSNLIMMNGAIPVTRSSNLVQKPQGYEVAEAVNYLENLDEETLKVESTNRRMDMELNDYPGSGANNRHTPRAQVARACINC